MAISIGMARTLRRPDNWEVAPDDRQFRHETIGDIYVADHGIVETGETIRFSAVFNLSNWALVKGYWYDRTMVNVTTQGGANLGQRRVRVLKYKEVERFENKYIEATIELWAK